VIPTLARLTPMRTAAAHTIVIAAAYWLFAIPTRSFCEELPGLNPKFLETHRVLRTIIEPHSPE
jgi:hypothetical protein